MRGDLLIGIVATTILATIINEAAGNDVGFIAGASWPNDVYETPDLSLLGNFNFDAFTELAFISAIVWAFSLFLADFFDTMGTLVGVGKPAGYLDEDGRLPRDPQAAARRLARSGRGRRVIDLVGDDLHRVGVRVSQSGAGRAGWRSSAAHSSSRSCSSRRSSAWCRRRPRRLR